jgi:hypothetical protein
MRAQKENNWVKVSDDGFLIDLLSGIRNIKRDDIKEINAYKLDKLTTDEICFDIVLSETVITISEEIEGWQTLTDKLEAILTGFDKDWFAKVAHLPFKTNLIAVYHR